MLRDLAGDSCLDAITDPMGIHREALVIPPPLVWSLPVTLVMAELSSSLPDEGGYVTWVRRAFGPFWAFQVGWWSWVDSFIDIAVYPALFTQYLSHWLPGMTPLAR